MSLAVPYWHVDAFADRPFAGNQAAVMPLDEWLPDEVLQAIGAENLFAETAFVVRDHTGAADWELRWFTPEVEIRLCGHATLASAFALWHSGKLAKDKSALFHTKSGELSCSLDGEAIRMDFPSEPPYEVTTHPNLETALGTKPVWVGQNRFDLFVELPHAHDVRMLGPRMAAIAMLGGRGVIVTAPSDDPAYDFVSRFFAPQSGVPEDHATGSAHCALGPYWGDKLGKHELAAFQASPRGAVIGVALKGERVDLIGRCALVLEGTLHA